MELQPPPGVAVTDDAGVLTIRIVRDRLLGVISIVLGVAMVGLAATTGDRSWTSFVLYAMDLVIVYAGLAWLLGTRIVRVDAHRVSAALRPLPLVPRNVAIDRANLERVELIEGKRGKAFGVAAFQIDGTVRLLAAFRDSDKTARAAASFVVQAIRAAL